MSVLRKRSVREREGKVRHKALCEFEGSVGFPGLIAYIFGYVYLGRKYWYVSGKGCVVLMYGVWGIRRCTALVA